MESMTADWWRHDGEMMRILLVDDEEELVSALAERLAFRGLDVDWTGSGTLAMEMVQQQHYDVAVIDMKMPKISGIELKRRLEALCPGLQYIFISGHGSAHIFQEGADEIGGAQFFLLKPVDIDVLISKLNTVMARSQKG